jgi:hypothetical protein
MNRGRCEGISPKQSYKYKRSLRSDCNEMPFDFFRKHYIRIFVTVWRFEKSSLDYRTVDISFRRATTQILKSSSNAPLALYRGVEQAERSTAIKESVLWGCPGSNLTRQAG